MIEVEIEIMIIEIEIEIDGDGDGTGAPGKGWRKLLNLETRRERRSLLDVFNFFAAEKQKGKRQTLL